MKCSIWDRAKQKLKIPVSYVVYERSNQSNGENTRTFYYVRKCVVHKEGKVKKLTEKHRKKWLVHLRLWSGGADQIMFVCANG